MIITCEQCQARFRLADEKLKPGGTKVRCSKCKTIFTVLPPEAAAGAEPAEFDALPAEGGGESGDQPPAPAAAEAPAFTAPEQPWSPAATGAVEPEGSSDAQEAGSADQSAAQSAAAVQFAPDDADQFGAGDSEFDFSLPPAASQEFAAEETATPGEFSFDSDALSFAAPGEDFAASQDEAAAPLGESEAESESEFGTFDFSTETAFGAATEGAADDGDSFKLEEGAFESGPLDFEAATAFGDESSSGWGEPEQAEKETFDFDEPIFAQPQAMNEAVEQKGAGLVFGEIDLPGGSSAPAAQGGPVFAPPPPLPPPAESRPAATSRPQREELLSATVPAPRSPVSTMMVGLVLLLLVLCGAGGYFYLSGEGQLLIDRLILKVKGEEMPVPLEQRIGLKISGSSYVTNREVGQLLVVQGTAINNFPGTRTAMAVKGLLLDGAGKVLQQQTVYCGNYLDDAKLRTMKYVQIEEAMSNQFGDSLSNMNVKAGAELRFTIVFRNVPAEMANINVEVVDSKPGGG